MASNLEAIASVASNLIAMASNLRAMASNLLAMASDLLGTGGHFQIPYAKKEEKGSEPGPLSI